MPHHVILKTIPGIVKWGSINRIMTMGNDGKSQTGFASELEGPNTGRPCAVSVQATYGAGDVGPTNADIPEIAVVQCK
jgi:hypothetical protein